MESSPLRERAEALIRQGQAAAQAGQQELARRYLQAAADIAPNNATAWLWLAGVQEPAEARESLKKVLELDPTNSRARAGLAWVERQLATALPPAPPVSPNSDATGALQAAAAPPPRATGPLAPPMAAPLPAERGTRSLSIEQELRAHLREMQPGSSQEAGEEGAEPDPLNRSRPERPVVTLPAEEEPVVDPATQRYRLLFLILLVLLVAGILVLAAAVVGLI